MTPEAIARLQARLEEVEAFNQRHKGSALPVEVTCEDLRALLACAAPKGHIDFRQFGAQRGPTGQAMNNKIATCWCFNCLNAPEHGLNNPVLQAMIVCPECGNKRCPRATDHNLACTGSNEPGQEGSQFAAQPTVKP